jgi:hypothetical protein
MKKSLIVLNASTPQFQKEVGVSAQKYEPYDVRRRCTDTRLQAIECDYEISNRLNCSVYVGRYETAIDYLPGKFAPDQSIEVCFEKQLIFVRIPGTGGIKMGIVRSDAVSEHSCRAGR